VLSDLIVAVPATLVVGLVPGWFWSRVLLASSDLYERLAYSLGLSITLVPTVAVVLSRFLGTGLTPGVAIASPVVVLLVGMGVYLRYVCWRSCAATQAPCCTTGPSCAAWTITPTP
jgi:hypothetical protein